MEERLRSHYESLSRAIGFTRAADAKAGPVLGLQIALLGALATRLGDFRDLATVGPWDAERVAFIAVAAVYVLLLGVVVVLAALVYLPMNPRTDRSLIYFEDIAAMEFEEFRDRAVDQEAVEIERQLLDQIYRVSRVASKKMRRVWCAITLSLPGLAFWSALLAWSYA